MKYTRHITKATSLFTIAVGCLVLAGWLLNIPALISISPGWASMKFNTALCFVLSGICLYLLHTAAGKPRRKSIGLFCAAIVFLIGLLSISEYIFSYSAGIDEFFCKEGNPTGAITFPGRMSELTAISFVLLGFVLLVLKKKKYPWLIQTLLFVVVPFSMGTIFIYFFSVGFLSNIPLLTSTALHTAILFIVLSAGVIYSAPLQYTGLSFQKKITGFFIMVALLLGMMFYTYGKNQEKERSSIQLLDHTNKVLFKAETLKALMNQIQSTIRSYIITGREQDVQLLGIQADSIHSIIKEIIIMTNDNTSQQLQIDTLQKLIDRYIAFMSNEITIRRNEGFEAAQKILLTRQSAQMITEAQFRADAIVQEENQLMAKRKAENEQGLQNAGKIITLFQWVIFLLLLSTFIVILNNTRRRNKAEAQMQEYQYFFNNNNDLCGIANTIGYFESINTTFSKVLGYAEKEFCETPFIELIHPDDVASTLHEYEKLKSGALVINFINRYRKKDGSYLYLDWNANPNSLTGKLYCVARDITENVNMLKEAEANEQYNKTIIESSPDCLKILDKNGHLLYMNFNGLCQMEIDDFSGFKNKEWWHLWGPENEALVRESVDKALMGETVSFSAFCPTAKGTPKWWDVTVSPVSVPGEPIQQIISVSRDITERKKAEENLLQTTSRLALATRAGGVGIWEWDIVNTKLSWDDQMYRLYGITAETFGGAYEAWVQGLHPEDVEKGNEEVQQALRGEKEFDTEFRVIWPDSSIHYIRGIANVERDAGGNALRMIGTNWDITEIKQSEEKFRSLINFSPLGIAVTNMQGIIQEANPAILNMMGFASKEEFMATPAEEYYADKNDREKILNLVKTNGYVRNFELRIKRKDREDVWLSHHMISIKGANNETMLLSAVLDITEIKKTEEALRDNNIFLDTLLENIPNMLFVKDAKDLRFIRFNRAGEKLLGYNKNDLIGKNDYNFFPKEQADYFISKDREIIKNAVVQDIKEEKISTANGERWLHTKKIPVFDKNGLPIFILGISEDITEQKRDQEILHNTLKEITDYKYALDESSIVAITDQKGIILQVNDNFCKISKYTREELIGQDHRIINSGYHPKTFIRNLWVTIANGKVWNGELKNKAKDGTMYWVDTTIVPFLNEEGKPYQYVAIRSDITERKRLEEEIKQFNLELEQKVKERTAALYSSEETRRLIMDSAMDAIVCIDADDLITVWTPRAQHLFGWTEQEIMGKKLSDTIIPHQYRHQHNTGFNHYKHTGEGPVLNSLIEVSAVNKAGREFPVELSIVPVKQDGETFFCGFIRDISERKRGEQALKESESFNRSILTSINYHIAVIEATGNVIAVNKAWDDFSIENGESVLKRTGIGSNYIEVCQKAVAAGDTSAAKALKGFQQVINKEILFFEMEYACHSLNEQRWFLLRAVKFADDSPKVVMMHIDITERKKAEEKIKLRNDTLYEIAFLQSHIVRKPIANILGISNAIDFENITNPRNIILMNALKTSTLELDKVIHQIVQNTSEIDNLMKK